MATQKKWSAEWNCRSGFKSYEMMKNAMETNKSHFTSCDLIKHLINATLSAHDVKTTSKLLRRLFDSGVLTGIVIYDRLTIYTA